MMVMMPYVSGDDGSMIGRYVGSVLWWLWGLTTSRVFFVGDVNIFGMRLFIQIRYFFVNNRRVFVTILTHWDCIYFTKFS